MSYAFTHSDLGKLNSISENVDFQISKDVSLNLKKTSDLCLLLYVKQYHYGCKSMQKKTDTSEFISKFIMQLEIEV